VTTLAGVTEPRTDPAFVRGAYDAGAQAYADLWSPMLVPAGRALLAEMPLAEAGLVLDLGAGTGGMVPALREAAPRAQVIAADLSIGMLRVARRATGVPAAVMSLDRLAVRGGVADAAVMCFVLFHLPDPEAALAAAASLLRPGGALGAATWAPKQPYLPDLVWNELLDAADGGPPVTTRCDEGLDTADALAARLRAAHLTSVKGWTTWVGQHFTLDNFVRSRTESGSLGLRLSRLDRAQQQTVVAQARARLAELTEDQWDLREEAVLAVGRRPV
jgi:SAM-dependent methyltransferase